MLHRGAQVRVDGLGRELLDALERRPARHPLKLAVGVLDVLPKSVVQLLLEPAMQLRGFNHLLGESGITFFGAAALAMTGRAGKGR